MLIPNPIYDNAFIHLLGNEKMVKFFISTFLGKNVLSIAPYSPELPYMNPKDERFKLFRKDFEVEVEEKDGQRNKMLVGMQKADKYCTHLTHFLRYLGHEYTSDTLPVTTIYILGFNIPVLDTACIRIGRNYYDLIEEKELKAPAGLVESLAHDCYIVQVLRITERLKTPLDRLLSVFEQKDFIDEAKSAKRYTYPINDEGVKEMAEMLSNLDSDLKIRKALEDESYYREYLKDTFGELYDEIEEKDQKLFVKAELAAKKAELAAKDF